MLDMEKAVSLIGRDPCRDNEDGCGTARLTAHTAETPHSRGGKVRIGLYVAAEVIRI